MGREVAKMMNRILLLIGLLLLSVLVSACGGKPGESPGAAESKAESESESAPASRGEGKWAPPDAEKAVAPQALSDLTISLEELADRVWEELSPALKEDDITDEAALREKLRQILEGLQAQGVVKPSLGKKAKEVLISWLIRHFVAEGRLPELSSQSDSEEPEKGK